MPTTKAKQGYTNCYFRKIIVANPAFTALTFPDVAVNVIGLNNFSLSNETASSVVEVSFNGTDVQDELDSTQTTKFALYANRTPGNIWFRLKSGSTATVTVRAW
jgi:hypothetical protein